MKSILLIDDDQMLLDVMSEIFHLEGFMVHTSRSSIMGVCIAQECEPDMIICDWMMPGLGGCALYKAFQSDPRTHAIPFLLMTGYADRSGIQRWTGLPSEQIIPKPFEVQQLVNVVKRLLSF